MSTHKFKPGDRVVINSEDEQVTIWQCTFWNGLPAYWVREWSDVILETGLRKYEPIHINKYEHLTIEIWKITSDSFLNGVMKNPDMFQ